MNNEISKCLKIASCICGKDGLISGSEIDMMFQIASKKYPSFTMEDFEKILDEFFDSEEQIEDYLNQIENLELREFTLKLSETSASVDGLDIRENIALKKAYSIWGMKYHE